jgi:hypothetical protein
MIKKKFLGMLLGACSLALCLLALNPPATMAATTSNTCSTKNQTVSKNWEAVGGSFQTTVLYHYSPDCSSVTLLQDTLRAKGVPMDVWHCGSHYANTNIGLRSNALVISAPLTTTQPSEIFPAVQVPAGYLYEPIISRAPFLALPCSAGANLEGDEYTTDIALPPPASRGETVPQLLGAEGFVLPSSPLTPPRWHQSRRAAPLALHAGASRGKAGDDPPCQTGWLCATPRARRPHPWPRRPAGWLAATGPTNREAHQLRQKNKHAGNNRENRYPMHPPLHHPCLPFAAKRAPPCP